MSASRTLRISRPGQQDQVSNVANDATISIDDGVSIHTVGPSSNPPTIVAPAGPQTTPVPGATEADIARARKYIPEFAPDPSTAPKPVTPSSEIAGALLTNAKFRRGHAYHGHTMERIHGLAPDDLQWSFTDDGLLRNTIAMRAYDGTVALILPPDPKQGGKRPIALLAIARPKQIPSGPSKGEMDDNILPTDYYSWTDTGECIRCDMYGRIDPTLATRPQGIK